MSYISQFVLAKAKKYNKTEAFRVYCSDILRVLAKCFGADIDTRYYDIVHNDRNRAEDRDPNEIKNNIIAGLETAYGVRR